MPKLPQDKAQAVNDAEGSKDFTAIPAGKYVVRLKDVEDTDKSGNELVGKDSGEPYWHWMFTVQKQYHPAVGSRVLHRNISLSKNAEGMIKDAFTAFGYDPSSDTQEIIDDEDAYAVAVVTVKPIPYGARKGEKDNEIVRLIPFDPAKWTASADGDEADPDGDWDTE